MLRTKKTILCAILCAMTAICLTLGVLFVATPKKAYAADEPHKQVAMAYNELAGCWYNEELGSYVLLNMIGTTNPATENDNRYFFSYATTQDGNLRWSNTPVWLDNSNIYFDYDKSRDMLNLTITVDSGLTFHLSYIYSNKTQRSFVMLGRSQRYEELLDPNLGEPEYTYMFNDSVLKMFDRYTYTSGNMQICGVFSGANSGFGIKVGDSYIKTISPANLLYCKSNNPSYEFCFCVKGETDEKIYFNVKDNRVDSIAYFDGVLTTLEKLTFDTLWDSVLKFKFSTTDTTISGWTGDTQIVKSSATLFRNKFDWR